MITLKITFVVISIILIKIISIVEYSVCDVTLSTLKDIYLRFHLQGISP
jgi:hypothetical protein